MLQSHPKNSPIIAYIPLLIFIFLLLVKKSPIHNMLNLWAITLNLQRPYPTQAFEYLTLTFNKLKWFIYRKIIKFIIFYIFLEITKIVAKIYYKTLLHITSKYIIYIWNIFLYEMEKYLNSGLWVLFNISGIFYIIYKF